MNQQELALQSIALKHNPLFERAITDIQKHLYDKWLDSSLSDATQRENIYNQKLALELIISRLDSYIFAYESQTQQEEQSY